jgi:hypothetical protein
MKKEATPRRIVAPRPDYPMPRRSPPKLMSPLRVLGQAALMLAGLGVIAAFIADIYSAPSRLSLPNRSLLAEMQELILMTNCPTVVSPDGLFRVARPPAWRMETGPDYAPYDLVFHSPNGVRIEMLATPVAYNSLEELYQQIRNRETDNNIKTEEELLWFCGRPTVKRIARLNQWKVFSLDFVESNVAHHILCSVPPDQFERCQPALMELLKTYQPLPPAVRGPPSSAAR